MLKLLVVAFATLTSSLLTGGGSTHATILIFEGLKDSGGNTLVNRGDINPNYGDNVGASPNSFGSYGQGNGFTPNITVNYFTRNITTGVVSNDHLDFWTTDYGDLNDVAYPVVNPGHYGEVWLIPESGYSVTLNSFDLAGWRRVDHLAQPIFILDEKFTVLKDWSGVIKGAGPSHTSIEPKITHSGPLGIRFGNVWNVGIDNINFDQCETATCRAARTPVPEPSTLLLIGSGFVGLALRRRKRKKASR